MSLQDQLICGQQITRNKGYKAVLRKSIYNHSFGGVSMFSFESNWQTNPTLILTIDLNDPKFKNLGIEGIELLPLFCFFEYNNLEGSQKYRVFLKIS